MNRLFSLLTFLIISFLVYGFYLSQFQFQLLVNKNKNSNAFYYDYKLSQNILSDLSVGSGSYATIAEQAKRSLNDFILFTDENPISRLSADYYSNNMGLLFGKKITTSTSRFIFYSPQNKLTENFSDLVLQAHPLEVGYDIEDLRKSSLDGIEVVNLKNISQKAWKKSKISTIWSLLFYPFNPRLALMRLSVEPTEELAIFDQISTEKKFNMYLGIEATARAIPFADWLIKFPSYERSLSVASQHLLLLSEMSGDINTDNARILTALKNGQFYIAFDELANPKGFESYIFVGRSKKRVHMGESISYSKDLKLYFKLPSEPLVFFEVVLFHNGKRIDHLNTYEGIFQLKAPGTYRLQVRLSPRLPLPDAIKWLSWIYTNNFYVNPS